jgi:predicted nucleic acid-binding protein
MIIVCNTGPLIALAKLDNLALLKELGFRRVLIPSCVQKELVGKIGPESNAIEAALDDFIEVERFGAAEQPAEAAASDLDEGEKEVILLGVSIKNRVILLLDDQAGRRVARMLSIPVTGTAGLLLSAKKQGLITAVLPLLISLREQGYWLSDALLAEIRRLSGE